MRLIFNEVESLNGDEPAWDWDSTGAVGLVHQDVLSSLGHLAQGVNADSGGTF